jgi:putative endonuclease
MQAPQKQWFVYIVECSDKTLYTGITNDISARIKAHNIGKGSRYTAFRYPVRLVYKETSGTKSNAMKRELEIKKYKRQDKLVLSNLI